MNEEHANKENQEENNPSAAVSENTVTDPIDVLQRELNEIRDQHVRLYAEFENYKRRTRNERADLIKTASSDLMTALLPILDDFDRALKAMAANEGRGVSEGILLIQQKMKITLEQRGLKPMDASGSVFDADLHEAITNIPVEDAALKGKIIEEVEKGYWLHDKVLRYAKVVVGQ
ncbi:MAG: nucleotide exchange factor GrpE [Sphingobacteriales bacterium]|jgi:molecular chaperone GrpE|nr:nucleotide exchange factor GrpE [Sphingobacteriales bacterium]